MFAQCMNGADMGDSVKVHSGPPPTVWRRGKWVWGPVGCHPVIRGSYGSPGGEGAVNFKEGRNDFLFHE